MGSLGEGGILGRSCSVSSERSRKNKLVSWLRDGGLGQPRLHAEGREVKEGRGASSGIRLKRSLDDVSRSELLVKYAWYLFLSLTHTRTFPTSTSKRKRKRKK